MRRRLRSFPPTSEASLVSDGGTHPERPGASARRRGALLFEGLENFSGVAFRRNLRPDTRNAAGGDHEERRPRRPPVRLAVIVLLDPRAVRLGDLVVLVGEQRERQVELLAERLLARAI